MEAAAVPRVMEASESDDHMAAAYVTLPLRLQKRPPQTAHVRSGRSDVRVPHSAPAGAVGW
jgi:hypothetical protein